MKPTDGRFGCGPSKVRPAALAALADSGSSVLGTSHRQAGVKSLVHRVRAGMQTLFSLPTGYEVILGNGGTTAFWDAAALGLVRNRAQHLTFGEFSGKFAAVTMAAPFLADPMVLTAQVGDAPEAVFDADVDAYAWAHNETSTGVAVPVRRPAGATDDQLVLIDATSGPAGFRSTSPRPTSTTSRRRRFSLPTAACGSRWPRPRQCSASPRSPRPIAGSRNFCRSPPRWTTAPRIRPSTRRRSRPCSCSPIRSTGSTVRAVSTGPSSGPPTRRPRLYDWAESSAFATPFVARPELRSQVVGTIDFVAEVDASVVAKTLRANGIVDTEPYRKLGRNQLRVGMFPAVEPDDVSALTSCVDFIVGRL